MSELLGWLVAMLALSAVSLVALFVTGYAVTLGVLFALRVVGVAL